MGRQPASTARCTMARPMPPDPPVTTIDAPRPTPSKTIIRWGYRILPPAGALAIMEMVPTTGPFQRILSNPFAYTAFKSTEPWLQVTKPMTL